jgi:hypothetical protein
LYPKEQCQDKFVERGLEAPKDETFDCVVCLVTFCIGKKKAQENKTEGKPSKINKKKKQKTNNSIQCHGRVVITFFFGEKVGKKDDSWFVRNFVVCYTFNFNLIG